jgi:hypothetical protein
MGFLKSAAENLNQCEEKLKLEAAGATAQNPHQQTTEYVRMIAIVEYFCRCSACRCDFRVSRRFHKSFTIFLIVFSPTSQTLICHSPAHIIRHRLAIQNRNTYAGAASKDYLYISQLRPISLIGSVSVPAFTRFRGGDIA